MAKDHDIRLPAPLQRGGYVARIARTAGDVLAAQRLRHLCFVDHAGRAALPDGIEADAFDARCDHVLIEDLNGDVVCCYRIFECAAGDVSSSYSAQFYDLSKLATRTDLMIELGRFCVHPDAVEPDILRLAWGMLAAIVDHRAAAVLFGCSSFAGTDAAPFRGAFDVLAASHLAPDRLAPQVKSDTVIRFADTAGAVTNRRAALGQLPPLLKTYLTMGGWVSDHAVIDADMNTLHVFTALEIAAIPAARARALRAVAQ